MSVETRPDQLDAAARALLGGRFEIQEVVHRGPQSVVYAARVPESGDMVALKVVSWPAGAGPEHVAAFMHRAERAAQLRHPHIVALLSFGATEAFRWGSMEYHQGGTLTRLLATEGALPLERCHRLVLQVASALDYAHRRGVVHGNLKSSNLLIDGAGWVRVSDFAVHQGSGVAPGAEATWSPADRHPFIAPEQYVLRESVSGPPSDQYALAALVCECLGISPDGVAAGAAGGAWADLPQPAREAIQRALNPSAYQRFSGILEFVAALDAVTARAREARSPRSGLRTWNRRLRLTRPKPIPTSARGSRIAASVAPILVLAATALWVLRLQLPAASEEEPARRGQPPLPNPAGSVVVQGPGAAPQPPAPTSTPSTPVPSPITTSPVPKASPAEEPMPVKVNPAPPVPEPEASRPQEMQRPAWIYVSSRPWGNIFVDERLVGHTPVAELPVTPGLHVLRVVREGFRPFERVIKLDPGDKMWLTGIELQQVKP